MQPSVSAQSDPPRPRTRGDLIKAAIVIIGVLVLLAVIWETRVLILLTVLGVLLGIAAKPAVDRLQKRKIPRGVGAPLVVGGVILLIGLVALWSGPTLVQQFTALRSQVPEAVDKLDAYFAREHSALLDAILPKDTTIAADSTQAASTRLGNALRGQVSGLRGVLFGAVTSTFSVMAGFLYAIILAIYVSIEPYTYRRGVLLMIPPASRDRMALLVDIVTATLRKWLATQFVAMLVIGIVTTLALLAIGVKSAIPLGILAGIFEFVPNIGPLMSAIPAVLIAFADSPQKALIVIIAYWGIQFLENHVLIPYLMREELDLPPALTLLWQAMMAILFGVLGLFVAVPILAASMVAVRYLYVRGDVPGVRRLRGSREVAAVTDDAVPGA